MGNELARAPLEALDAMSQSSSDNATPQVTKKKQYKAHDLEKKDNCVDHPRMLVLQKETYPGIQQADSSKKLNLRILSLDGGWFRCATSLEVLRGLEERLGEEKPIGSFFDIIVGTAGSALAAVLLGTKQKSVLDIIKIYEHIGKQGLLNDTVVFETFLHSLLDGLDFQTPSQQQPLVFVVIPDDTKHVHVYGSHIKSDVSVYEAVLATSASAAFKPVILGGYSFTGRGMLVDNPTCVAGQIINQMFPGSQWHCVVSLGTGLPHEEQVSDESPFLPSESYFFRLSPYGLSSATPTVYDAATFQALRAVGQNYCVDQRWLLSKIVQLLSALPTVIIGGREDLPVIDLR
jgi:hypothetical protein